MATIDMIGYFGGRPVNYISQHFRKSVLALIVEKPAPAKNILSHTGAVVTYDCGSAQRKIDVLRDAGVEIAETTEDIPALLEKI
jgi:succinyl-CoA synthetase alpha subunit